MDRAIITFDGFGGSGKTTQKALLAVHIQKKCMSPIRLERGATPLKIENVQNKTFELLEHCYYDLIMETSRYPLDLENYLDDWYGSFYPSYKNERPWLSFYMNVPPHISAERAIKRGHNPEAYDTRKNDLLQKSFEKRTARLSNLLPNFHVIDGLRSIDIIHQEIVEIFEERWR